MLLSLFLSMTSLLYLLLKELYSGSKNARYAEMASVRKNNISFFIFQWAVSWQFCNIYCIHSFVSSSDWTILYITKKKKKMCT